MINSIVTVFAVRVPWVTRLRTVAVLCISEPTLIKTFSGENAGKFLTVAFTFVLDVTEPLEGDNETRIGSGIRDGSTHISGLQDILSKLGNLVMSTIEEPQKRS